MVNFLKISGAGALLFIFGCNDAEFSSERDYPEAFGSDRIVDEDGMGSRPREIIEEDIELSLSSCDIKSAVKEKIFQLEFPAISRCPYGVNGNGRRGQYRNNITARRSQEFKIELPENTILCSISLEGETNSFNYDDAIDLVFEKYWLAGWHSPISNYGMTNENGLILWDWLRMRGKSYSSGADSQCAPGTECLFPRTQHTGKVRVNAPLEWFKNIPEDDLKKQDFSFYLVISGNDERNDCRHNGLELPAKVRYIQKNN